MKLPKDIQDAVDEGFVRIKSANEDEEDPPEAPNPFTFYQKAVPPTGVLITVAFDRKASRGGRWYWEIHTKSIDTKGQRRDTEARDFHSLIAVCHHLYKFLLTRTRHRYSKGFYDIMDTPKCDWQVATLEKLCADRGFKLKIKPRGRV